MGRDQTAFSLSGQIVDVVAAEIFPGTISVSEGRIQSVERVAEAPPRHILPGLIDAHVHIESSMLPPSEFARLAAVHGTTATVSDPHEIANVLGLEGVRFMIDSGCRVPFRFYFGAPSCVPATPFETSGAALGVQEVDELLAWPEIGYLAEMMNFPAVLNGDAEVMAKLASARKHGKPVDGHAPGVLGEAARRYAAAGISTDHECFGHQEALDKVAAGMKVLIREGSAARNFDELIGLISDHPGQIMFCSDDKHPDDLVRGHINLLIRRALEAGYGFMDVVRACTLNPVRHYGLDAGLLQPGDHADFILIDNPQSFGVQATYIGGIKVAEEGRTLIEQQPEERPNRFQAQPLTAQMLRVEAKGRHIRVMEAHEGQLMTGSRVMEARIQEGQVVSDTHRDLLKLLVMNRYSPTAPAIGFVTGFGLKRGALASTVAHDSHNIIALGVDDESLVRAVNMLIEAKGGIAAVDLASGDFASGDYLGAQKVESILPLPIAGIMSADDGYEVARAYSQLDQMAKDFGSSLQAPFMTLSFMALLVIPELKLSDKGLFDGKSFSFTSLFV